MARQTLFALLGDDLEVGTQLRWARHLARLRDLDILLVQRIEGGKTRFEDINLDAPAKPDEQPEIAAVKAAVAAVPDLVTGEEAGDAAAGPDAPILITARALYYDSHEASRQAINREINHLGVALFTIAKGRVVGQYDRDFVEARGLLFEYLPCEAFLVQGLTDETAFDNIAVLSQEGISRQSALRLACDFADAGGSLTVLQVNKDVGIDSAPVGDRRLDRFLATYPEVHNHPVTRRVIVDDDLQSAVHGFWDENRYDLLIVPATSKTPETSTGLKFGRNIPTVVTLGATPMASRAREFLKEGLRQHVPQIARGDRVSLVDRVESNAEWNFDFVALMILSASIASMGLIQNSAAVVIGAMLVAPLMTPLIGLGLALVQGNPVLAMMSARSVARGIIVALLSGFVMGILNPGFDEPTREILARGGPGLIDLAVAFLSGIAAAYAQSRPNLLDALPGVAIAAALVPPIAASGLALSLGEFYLALGAFMLFVINMVAIILSAMLALYAVGIRQTRGEAWTVRSGSALIVAFCALIVLLTVYRPETEVTKDIPVGIEQAVEGALGPGYALRDIAIAYDELGYQLNIDVTGREPVPPELANAVRLKASEFYDRAVRIRLVAQISAEEF